MESNQTQRTVCPWCQTEIVWDPEIGPEDTCPYCSNELGDFRTIKLKVVKGGLSEDGEDALAKSGTDESVTGNEDSELDETDEMDQDVLNEMDLLDDYDEDHPPNPYAENVMACMDTQEEAPECSNCHELMLLAGHRTLSAGHFQARVPEALGKAFLPETIRLNLYVCPACFKTDEYLDPEDREFMIHTLSGTSPEDSTH